MLSDVGEISGEIVGKSLCKPRIHKIGNNNAVGIYCRASRAVMVEHSREPERTVKICVLGGDGYLGWPTSSSGRC
jgi:hypothetical protein